MCLLANDISLVPNYISFCRENFTLNFLDSVTFPVVYQIRKFAGEIFSGKLNAPNITRLYL